MLVKTVARPISFSATLISRRLILLGQVMNRAISSLQVSINAASIC